jgi:hypothetical protein
MKIPTPKIHDSLERFIANSKEDTEQRNRELQQLLYKQGAVFFMKADMEAMHFIERMTIETEIGKIINR